MQEVLIVGDNSDIGCATALQLAAKSDHFLAAARRIGSSKAYSSSLAMQATV